MWFATKVGLFRFDGYTLKEYLHQPNNEHSIPNFNVTRLLIDHKGELWVGTSFGLVKYRRLSDDFITVSLIKDNRNVNPVILKLFEDSKNNIWVGTRQHGIFKLSEHYQVVRQLDDSELSSNFIRDIYEDYNNDIWIATAKGLDQYERSSEKLVSHSTNENLIGYDILSIGQFSKKSLLLGTDLGLLEYDLNSKIISHPIKDVNEAANTRINKLIKGFDDDFIFATNNDGVGVIDFQSGSVVSYKRNDNDSESLISNRVYSLFLDNMSGLWIGTDKGVSKIDKNLDIFSLYRMGNNECLSGNESYAILQDSRAKLWIGIKDKGLQSVDLITGYCRLYNDVFIDGKHVKFNFILDIKEDREGNIWVANYQEGLIKFTPKTSTFSRFKPKESQLIEVLESSFIYKIEIGDKNKIWLGLEDDGVIELNTKDGTALNLTSHISQQIGKNISNVKTIQKYNNTLWLTTSYQGLISVDLSTYTATQFVRKNKKKPGIPENISAARVSDKGTLWLGSRGYGLFSFNVATHEIENYTKIDGLADNTVWNIEIDNNNFVWIGTDDGLSVFDPINKTFMNFFINDGLQSNEATTSGFFEKKSGIIWTGGMNGINRIETKNFFNRVKEKANSPTFNDIKVNNESIDLSMYNDVRLMHYENNLKFLFSSINFKVPHKVMYRYKLQGFEDWREVDFKNRYANYTNLIPGNYTFKVAASLNNQWENAEEASIKIFIKSPWWKTNFAYFLFICAFAALIYSIIYLRTRILIMKAADLEQLVKERTQELHKEKQKVEKLLSNKNEEFANISHELRTPLTLIQGPVHRLISDSKDKEQLNRLMIIQRNANRLARIVDQLFHIEIFKIKSISDRKNQATKMIILRIIEAFKDVSQEKNIDLKITNISDVNLEFTPDALEKIILNLLSNSLKYTKSGGLISVGTYRVDNEFVIKVSDTGVGIPENKLDIIFERYSRVLDDNYEKVTGAGIGLSLVKSLIEAHNGRIEILSKIDIGTEITIFLPIENEQPDTHKKTFINDEFIAMELMELNHQSEHSSIGRKVQIKNTKKSNKPLILVIEDNSDMVEYIFDSISLHYNILIAENGEVGITKAKLEVPDLIICDIMMPKKDGYQVTNELRHNNVTSHIPIVLLTARGDKESRLKGWHEKADEYLTKPFDAEELLVRLQNILDIRSILRKQFSKNPFKLDEQSLKHLGDPCLIKDASIARQQKFIEQLNEILEGLYVNSDTSIANIAAEIAMSERQFFRKMKSVLDITPSDYLKRFRLEKAKNLLDLGHNASYAAFEVGFTSQSYFGKCFRAEFGLLPSEYKKKLQNLNQKNNNELV
jgi:signal transduction histidine kinase/ligand-binding sensor domain-containing protein/DNA-binding response OmpR family regulator